MRNVMGLLQFLLVLGPAVGLLVAGLVITLRSGVANLSSVKGLRTVASNLSWLLFRVAGYVAGLAALHRLMGFRLDFGS